MNQIEFFLQQAARLKLGAGLLALLISQVIPAAALELPENGWVKWRTDAVADAPSWCCFDWQGDQAMPRVCDLDSRHINYGDGQDSDGSPENMQVYALLENGVLQKVRALTPACPVKSDQPVTDLGRVAADDSVQWLAAHISPRSNISTHVLAAIAVHSGDQARDILVNTAGDEDNLDNRKHAVFWMGQVRALETADELRRIMFNDRNAKLREHAAFSISQSVISDRAAALIRLGKTDQDAKVRSQAWFWLAQTKAPESEAAIFAALQTESSSQVKKQAIFALSQLPGERAVKALASILENQQSGHEARKQALFWLAQDESELAFEYIDELLAAE